MNDPTPSPAPDKNLDEKSRPLSNTIHSMKDAKGRSFDEWIDREKLAGRTALVLVIASAVSVMVHQWGTPSPYMFALGSCAMAAAAAIVFVTRAPVFVMIIMAALLAAKLLSLGSALT